MGILTLPSFVLTTTEAATSRRLSPISATATKAPPCHQITHSMPPEKVEVFKSLEPWATKTMLPLLKPVEKCWQPSEFLPDPMLPDIDFMDKVWSLRRRTRNIPDDYFVVLVGDMITEEALPTYQSMFNLCDGVRDDTGAGQSPWAIWTRAWTAEENRHGDLLRNYLFLSGRVDTVMIEKTIQYLIGAGMNIGTENNPYIAYVYTSFQERATFISHANTARQAKEHGDPILARICGTISADEKRHENAYVKVVEKLLEVDPNETMLAIGNIMRKGIKMPAHLMKDGQDQYLYKHFATVAQRIGVYTSNDYVDILEFLIGRWNLEKIEGLKGDGRHEQEHVCSLAPKLRKLIVRENDRTVKKEKQKAKFSWILNKEVIV